MTTSFAVFQLLLVGLLIQTAAADREKLKVVFTMNKIDYGDIIGPALLAPIKKMRDDVEVDWKIIDTKNKPVKIVSEFFSTINAFKPHVIIGEKQHACCDIMATLAAANDTFFISLTCNPMQFVIDRESFPTYATTKSAPFSYGLIVDLVMKRFRWTRVAIISTPEGVYTVRSRYLKKELEEKKQKVFSFSHAKSNGTWEDFKLREKSISLKLTYLADRATLFVFMMVNEDTQFLLKLAKTMGLMNGKHAFLTQACIEDIGQPKFVIEQCEGLLTVDRVVKTETPEWRNFQKTIRSGFDSDDWKNNTKWTRSEDFDIQTPQQKRHMQSAAYLHDSVLLWMNVLKKAKDKNRDLSWETVARQGKQLSTLSRDVQYDGVTGRVLIKNGRRMANWTVSMIQNGKPNDILEYEDETGKLTDLKPDQIIWPGGGTTVPKQPDCFVDECKDEAKRLLIIICSSVAAAVVAILLIGFLFSVLWKFLQEKKIIVNWRIIWTDVALIADANTSANSSAERRKTTADHKSIGSSGHGRLYITAGIYKGTMIAIKAVPRDSVNIFERTIYKELRQLLYVKHDNINPFIGVCVDSPNICVAMAYAEKGSIQNVLADQQYEIDWDFRTSLALDVVQGMEYLHSTPVGAHGHLTSANCVIDERWVCKITDYGLKIFRCIDKLQRPSIDLLWTAPEILRKKDNDTIRVQGTKPGDVYSFGIIISELLTRELPYQSGMRSATLEELLAKVKMSLKPPFRPQLPAMEGHIAGEWIGLAKNCWQTETNKRPTFRTVKSILLAHHSGKFTNVLERMQMMLEESIERANTDLLVERRKTEAMLESILPRPIVEKISSGAEFEPQLSDFVTLCLCDTIGFYKATNYLPADVVVDALKSLYQQYDEIVGKYGAFEINTSGGRDSMMLAGGLSINPKVDAEAICTMSLELLSFIGTFTHPRIETRGIQMKTTIHTGSAYAALMGNQMPQLHVFGEMVQTASDLHIFGNNMVIRISGATRDLLPAIGGFKIQKGDDVTLKDSLVAMYVVTGKEGFTMPLPSPVIPVPAPSPTPLPTPIPTRRRKSTKVVRRSTGAGTKKK